MSTAEDPVAVLARHDINRLDGADEEAPEKGAFEWDWDHLYASMTYAQQGNHDRRMAAWRVQHAMFRRLPWMRWPLLSYVYSFWALLFDEGVRQTLTPRWGGITFSYLNDGIRPSLWHTWQGVMHPGGEWDGIYTQGAPRSLAEAEAVRDGTDPRYPNYGGGE